MLIKLDFFSMVPSIVVLGTQIHNIKQISSKDIIKSIAQKVMAKYDFGSRFHDLKYFEVGKFLILEFFINLRAPLQKFV